MQVVDRLMTWVEHYEFKTPTTFSIGAASCPTHGVDLASLRRGGLPNGPTAPRTARQFERSMRMTDMKPTLLSSLLVALLSVAPALAQAPVPPVPAARPTVASNATDYKLVVGDKLRVEVYRDPQMSQSFRFGPTERSRFRWSAMWSRPEKHRPRCATSLTDVAEGIHHQPGRHGDRRRSAAADDLGDR